MVGKRRKQKPARVGKFEPTRTPQHLSHAGCPCPTCPDGTPCATCVHYIEIIGALVFNLKEKVAYLEDHARYLSKKIDNRASQAMRTIKAALEDEDE